MAEVNDEVIDDVTDVTDDNDTTGLDDDTAKLFSKYGIDPDNADTNDLLRVIQRAEKAESRIVKDKKAEKVAPKSESSDVMTKADYAIEKFLDKNPELSEYTKELGDYQKKGLSLDEAKTLILNSDKARVNREKVNSLGLSDGEPGAKKETYTQEELAKMKPEQAQKIWAMASKGQVKVR